jgi:DNA-binding transcriptional regulator PaaX
MTVHDSSEINIILREFCGNEINFKFKTTYTLEEKIKSLENKRAIILTKEGISKALMASFTIEGAKKRMDGKWVMLMFDIPVTNKKARSLLKSILINLGYKLFQQSVWISPYDISEKTEKLLQFHSLDGYVKTFLIEKV